MKLRYAFSIIVFGLSAAALGIGNLDPANAATPVPVSQGSVATAPEPLATPTPRTSFELSNPPVTPDITYPASDYWSSKWPHITVQEAERLWKTRKALFVDARGKNEWDQGHLPGAIPLPAGDFDKFYDENIKKIKKAKVLISYCHGTGCHLADKTADKLVQKGHKNVASFFGGWPHWTQAGLPTEDAEGKEIPTPAPAPTAAPVPAAVPAVSPSLSPDPVPGK